MTSRATTIIQRREHRMSKIEAWHAGGAYSYIFAQDPELAKFLRKKYGAGTTYYQNGRLLGRQFMVPTRSVALVARQMESRKSTTKFGALKHNNLEADEETNLPLETRSTDEGSRGICTTRVEPISQNLENSNTRIAGGETPKER